MTDSDIKIELSDNIPMDDSSTAGGGASGTYVTNASEGEWMPKLRGQASGTIDTDAEVQYQLAYVTNTHGSETWANGGFYMDNCLIFPPSSGNAKVQSTSSSDGATKKVRFWGLVSGVLDYEDLTLNGTTLVVGLKSFSKFYRITAMLTADDSLTTLAGRADLKCGSTDVGHITQGETHASAEFEYCFASTLGDLGTFANRRTSPGSLAWARPNTPATRCYVKDDDSDADLDAGEKCGLYCRQTVQPGMPQAVIRRVLIPYGEAA